MPRRLSMQMLVGRMYKLCNGALGSHSFSILSRSIVHASISLTLNSGKPSYLWLVSNRSKFLSMRNAFAISSSSSQRYALAPSKHSRL